VLAGAVSEDDPEDEPEDLRGRCRKTDLYREALELALRKLKTKDRFESEVRVRFWPSIPHRPSITSLRSLKNVES
jgi:hypothetical protein